jgi:hypothetical protein
VRWLKAEERGCCRIGKEGEGGIYSVVYSFDKEMCFRRVLKASRFSPHGVGGINRTKCGQCLEADTSTKRAN